MNISVSSTDLKVFPISSSRIGHIYTRKPDSDTSTLTDEKKEFVDSYEYISADEYNEKSDDVKAFYEETTGQASVSNGRALTERNISALIRKLSDRPGYVVDEELLESASSTGNYTDNSFIEFILAGRYFRLSLKNQLLSSLWVAIELRDKDGEFETLSGIDSVVGGACVISDKILFSTTEPLASANYDYTLQLIEQGGLTVPIDSRFRFEKNVIKNICGGTV